MTHDEETGRKTDEAPDGAPEDAAPADAAAPPPPPPAESAAPPPPPDLDPGKRKGTGFDLGYLFSFFFRDPRVVPKLLFGCLAFLFIPVLGIGLVALAGYALATARGALRGDEHPMPEWDDLGAILLDGLKVAVVVLAYSAAGAAAGICFLGFTALWVAIGESVGSPAVVILSVFGVVVTLFFVSFLVLVLKGLLPVGLLRLAATDRLGDAFRLSGHLRLIQANLGTFFFLLLSLILFHLLSEATVLLCIIGIVPGVFWGAAASGAAIGHAGRLMGVRVVSAAIHRLPEGAAAPGPP